MGARKIGQAWLGKCRRLRRLGSVLWPDPRQSRNRGRRWRSAHEIFQTTKSEKKKTRPPSVAFVCVFCVRKRNHYHRKHRTKPHRNMFAKNVLPDSGIGIGWYALAYARASDRSKFRIHHSAFPIKLSPPLRSGYGQSQALTRGFRTPRSEFRIGCYALADVRASALETSLTVAALTWRITSRVVGFGSCFWGAGYGRFRWGSRGILGGASGVWRPRWPRGSMRRSSTRCGVCRRAGRRR